MSNTTLMGYSAVSENILRATYPNLGVSSPPKGLQPKVDAAIERIRKQLGKYVPPAEITHPKEDEILEILDLLPEGDTLFERVKQVAHHISKDYFMLMKYLEKKIPPKLYPPKIEEIKLGMFTPGWNKFNQKDRQFYSIPYPDEPILHYDTETFVKGSPFPMSNCPVIGTAVGDTGEIYVWIHEIVLNPEMEYIPQLISLGPTVRAITAHNAAFDVTKTLEFYTDDSPPLVIDTMSMHQVTAGITSSQFMSIDKPWGTKHGSKANLSDVQKFHLGMEPLNKETRNIFVDATHPREFTNNFQELLKYAIGDVVALPRLVHKLIGDYLKTVDNNPISINGMAKISFNQLPLDPDFIKWYNHCEEVYTQKQEETQEIVRTLADEAYQQWKDGIIDETTDPWLSQLDWSVDSRMKNWVIKCVDGIDPKTGKEIINKVKKEGSNRLIQNKVTYRVPYNAANYGVPKWYVEAYKKESWGTKGMLAHTLAKLSYMGMPVQYTTALKYHIIGEDGKPTKIPHTSNIGANVGGILTQNYVPFFEAGTIKSNTSKGEKLLELAINCCYWTSVRSRVAGVIVVEKPDGSLVTVANHKPHQTITGRSGSELLSTLPAPQVKKIGSETRVMFTAGEGEYLIHFDVDAQEAVIAMMISSVMSKIIGSTPFGYQVLAGDKAHKTDIHSSMVTYIYNLFNILIERFGCKQLNYAMMYFCGQKGGLAAIWEFVAASDRPDPALATDIVKAALQSTRGTKIKGSSYFEEASGTQTEFFNAIITMMGENPPRRPMLGVQLSKALHACNLSKPGDQLTSRFNAFVQGSGVDFMHTLVSLVEYLSIKMGVPSKFLMSYHDEYAWRVAKPYARKLAKIAAVAHYLSWAMLIEQLGLYLEVPLATAFPSTIDIKTRFDKDNDREVHTPSWDTFTEGFSLTPMDIFAV